MVVELDLGEYKSLMMLGNLQNSVGCASECLYIHTDHLGTPQVITDQSQTVVWSADYEPFGKVNITTSTIENPLRFPGQYYDQETQLHYNYFRDYDPAIGRYITSDPIGLAGGINTYSYVLNNPLKYTDPLGLSVVLGSVCTAVGAALTAQTIYDVNQYQNQVNKLNAQIKNLKAQRKKGDQCDDPSLDKSNDFLDQLIENEIQNLRDQIQNLTSGVLPGLIVGGAISGAVNVGCIAAWMIPSP